MRSPRTLTAVMHALGPNWMDPQYLLATYGSAFFWISLAIVFVECGLFFPILPGDSLLFAIGIFAASGQIDVSLAAAIPALFVAAFAGNVVGYEIGRKVGPPLLSRPNSRLIKQKHVDQTFAFFDQHGRRAIVLARFVPIVRTFITVVAGIGRMDRRTFFTFSGIGALLWATGVTVLGYFLGTVPFIKGHIETMLIAIVAVSLIPMGVEFLRARRSGAKGGRDARYDEAPERARVVDEDVNPTT